MAAWLKTFREGNEHSPHPSPTALDGQIGKETEFYEPLSTHTDGTPKLTKHAEPLGKPNYAIGELVGTYWNGSHVIGSVWEVTGEPERAEKLGWGWKTPVRLVAKSEPGVPLSNVSVDTSSLRRRIRLRFDAAQEASLRAEFGL
jgi:hypothetical protein